MNEYERLREEIKTELSNFRHKVETEHYDFHYDALLETLNIILSKVEVKADEQNVDLSFLLNTGSTVPIQVRTVDAMLKENWVKVVDKEATNG